MEKSRKICNICNIDKDIGDFYRDKGKKDGRRNFCKECTVRKEHLKAKIGIYKIVSPSKKVYIGQSRNIHKRMKSYQRLDNQVKTQVKLYNSIKKYGWDNHIFEVVEYCEIGELKCRERYWQDFFDVLGDKGLNLIKQECEDNYRVMSEETRERISLSNFGKKRSEETKKKIGDAHRGKKFSDESKAKLSESLKRNYHLNGNPRKGITGFKHTEETKLKMSEAQKGHTVSEETRQKIRDANLGRKHTEETKEKLRGERPHCRGENHPFFNKPMKEETKTKLSESLKNHYNNNPEAREKISQHMSGENHRQWGIPIGEYQKERIKEVNSKVVLDLKTGIYYNSAKEASEYYNIKYSTLRCYLNGSYPNKTSLIYC